MIYVILFETTLDENNRKTMINERIFFSLRIRQNGSRLFCLDTFSITRQSRGKHSQMDQ